jgi:hypothetical protein
MENDMKQQSIIHLFPRRSLMNEDIIQQDSSDMKITSRKFSYKKMCAQCIPNSIRSDQEKNQEINLNLLYTYDPFQIEVRYSPVGRVHSECDDKCRQDLIFEYCRH